MSKILLINPLVHRSEITKENLPTGLLWIGSWLIQNDYDVKIIVANNWKDIEREIKSSLCVGLSTMTRQIPNALEISNFIKDIDPSIPIIWGGVHSILFPEQTCVHESIDIAVTNEGEQTMLELVKHLEGKLPLKEVDGICCYQKRIIKTKPREFINMNDLERIEWEMLEKKMLNKFKDIEIPIQTSRGCPYSCTYCINVITNNRMMRFRNIEKVLQDVRDVLPYGAERIRFRDEYFFLNLKRVEKIVDGMMEFNVEWFGNIRCDDFARMDMKLLEKMKKSGCTRLGTGVESGSQRILDFLKKEITVNDAINAAKICKKIGITPIFSFMMGLPTETNEEMKQTIALMHKLKHIYPEADFTGPQIFRPYPGGRLYELSKKMGFKEPKRLKDWTFEGSSFASLVNMPWIWDNRTMINTISYMTYWLSRIYLLKNSKSPEKKRLFKILYSYSSRLRWHLKFFGLPIEVFIHGMIKEVLK